MEKPKTARFGNDNWDSEFLVFNDKNDDRILGIGVNSKNREKLSQITEFVQGKVESSITRLTNTACTAW